MKVQRERWLACSLVQWEWRKIKVIMGKYVHIFLYRLNRKLVIYIYITRVNTFYSIKVLLRKCLTIFNQAIFVRRWMDSTSLKHNKIMTVVPVSKFFFQSKGPMTHTRASWSYEFYFCKTQILGCYTKLSLLGLRL